MKELFSIDLKDYSPNDSVFRRPSARAIIIKNNIIALVYSIKEKYYKFPGGGIKDDEDMLVALAREVKEEVGLIVKPESISEFGSVMRRQKSNYTDNTIFEQENYYFWCECDENVVDQNLDDYEKEAEFTLKYVDIDEAIKVNSEYRSDDFFNEIMIQREKKVLELIKEYIGECAEILDTNEMIYIGSDFPDEYAHSKDTKVLRGPNEYAKANASVAIKELIQIATNKAFSENYKDKHNSKAKYGW